MRNCVHPNRPNALRSRHSFRGSYVYAGSSPTVMTDPGGKRFGKADIGGVNQMLVRAMGVLEKHNDSDTNPNVPGSAPGLVDT
jgi:hypothetical protein